ncbi:hypothetical protein CHLNCDRAFT_134905 [Chlorella variabilis]|uniref:Uncharacterized protein n=1 Tax=Chlorella variabilis TaxID=554065 RepID=E1ZH30_CHLVA|nr:hypothetical protein CHLNCDRAFT_134905 [Chlorella variabilis]EFN55046.1 hypothetical protein CHLNCDRAFT_134905 [Chlorella variabilis]|eukprot:XP_005847148.1 hypothetical protein CHLNCDRAFT_134905 [Chlorella variabilis]
MVCPAALLKLVLVVLFALCVPDAVPASGISSLNYTKIAGLQKCVTDFDCCSGHCITIGGIKGCLPCVPVPLVKCVSDFDCCFGAKCNLQNTKCCLANGQACVKQVNLTQPVTPGELCCSGQCDSASNTCSNCIGVGSTGCTTDAQCCNKSSCVSSRCCVKAGGACITGIENSDCCSKDCKAGICQ